jgi:hypothetical protein
MTGCLRSLLLAAALAAGFSACTRMDGDEFRRIQLVMPSEDSPNPVIELVSCKVMEETSFIKIIGKVRNISSRPVSCPVAKGFYRDISGSLLASETALIWPPVLLPGSEAHFLIVTPAQRAIKNVAVAFVFPLGTSVPARYQR